MLKQAITGKKIIVATYGGHRREMCPHIVGSTDGLQMALCYQFGGGSSQSLAPDGSDKNWRCVRISALSDVVIQDGEWHTASKSSPVRPKCIQRIDVQAAN